MAQIQSYFTDPCHDLLGKHVCIYIGGHGRRLLGRRMDDKHHGDVPHTPCFHMARIVLLAVDTPFDGVGAVGVIRVVPWV